jgi:hypothetical protein
MSHNLFTSRLNSLLACGLVCLGIVPAARAAQVAFRLDYAIQGEIEGVQYQSTKFAVYFEPLKINWAALSQISVTPTVEGTSRIDDQTEKSGLLDGHVLVSIIDPWGKRGPAYMYDGNDPGGNPVGQQALMLGNEKLAPQVVRFNKQGKRFELKESGLFDDFLEEGGPGYYTIQITYVNEGGDQARNDVYLLMDVIEGYRQKPPILTKRQGDIAMLAEYGGGGGSGSDHGGITSLAFPNGDDPDNDDDDNDSHFFPPGNPGDNGTPDPPDGPVVPEPATIMLVGLGLAGAGLAERRRKRGTH